MSTSGVFTGAIHSQLRKGGHGCHPDQISPRGSLVRLKISNIPRGQKETGLPNGLVWRYGNEEHACAWPSK